MHIIDVDISIADILVVEALLLNLSLVVFIFLFVKIIIWNSWLKNKYKVDNSRYISFHFSICKNSNVGIVVTGLLVASMLIVDIVTVKAFLFNIFLVFFTFSLLKIVK